VSLYEQLDPRVDREHFEALLVLGRASRRRGDAERAQVAFEAARKLAEDGGRPPLIAEALFVLGHLAYTQGRFEAAERLLERSLLQREAFHGADSSASVRPRQLLAAILRQRGRAPQAVEQASLAAQMLNEQVPPKLHGEVHELLGGLYRQLGQWDDALASYRNARTAWLSLPAPDRITLALLDSNMADCMLAKRELDAARKLYDEVLLVLSIHVPADDPRRAYPLLGRGRLLLGQGERDAGIADLRRAQALPGVRELDASLATALQDELDSAVGLRP
jgi:tetratricopeptide (TPR) repeat protein